MRLNLIWPESESLVWQLQPRNLTTYPVSLTLLAALTPDNWDIKIIDERIGEKIDFDEQVDLVGIAVRTLLAPRAYQIAAEYRKRGVKVVMGGPHVSVLPSEASMKADAIVIGEAEPVWAEVIKDFEAGQLKRYYKSDGLPALGNHPIPRYDLVKGKNYSAMIQIESSRGCPHTCSYCSVPDLYGKSYRERSVSQLLEEISMFKEMWFNEVPDMPGAPKRKLHISFVDDNIWPKRKHTREMLEALTKLDVEWSAQASIVSLRDPEFLSLAKESGCQLFGIGLESINQESLLEVNKKINQVDQFAETIQMIHDHNIGIQGYFMFGFDHDKPDGFDKTADFIIENHIEMPVFFILTPYPGTSFYNHLNSQGRIFNRNWARYDAHNLVINMKGMSNDDLKQGFLHIHEKVYGPDYIDKRLAHLPQFNFFRFANKHLEEFGQKLRGHWDEVEEKDRQMASIVTDKKKFNLSVGGSVPQINLN
ncbi:radical SAM protein [Candidatus Chlorohelix sp.]|uniref:B12-binding domain-containing radical SAM protein n=1 Tax=Candidatus Chlorohelix sp. TaxID=3139201 RepID=UPI0030645F8B